MTKEEIQTEIPYYQTQEFKDSMKRAIQSYSYHPSEKKLRKSKYIKDGDHTSMSRYDIEDINRWLQNPNKYEEELRKLSNFLYDTNPIYKLIIRYMALLPKYRWHLSIDAYGNKNPDKVKQNFIKACNQIEKMNLPLELMKASLIAYKNDFFFGYEIETKNDYFIFALDNKYCKPSSIESGIYNFQFDFSYFDNCEKVLNDYPIEFKQKYTIYKSNKRDKRWQELDSKKSVCFKINIETAYPMPIFSGMFPSLYDLEDYKQLKKERAKNDNYLLLHQLIPMDDKVPDLNKFLIDLDLAAYFHDAATTSLPNGIEVVTSPMELTAVKTEKTKNDNDYVVEALRDVYDSGGISQFLFNSDKSTSVGLNKSVNTDEEIAFALLRQMETWVNRKLKQMFNFKCKFSFLDVTIFNQNEVFEEKLKSAQYGFSTKFEVAATMGMTPLDVLNNATLENDIFGLHEMFIPLSSSHTQSGDSEGGAPEKSDNEVSDEALRSKDLGNDERRSL